MKKQIETLMNNGLKALLDQELKYCVLKDIDFFRASKEYYERYLTEEQEYLAEVESEDPGPQFIEDQQDLIGTVKECIGHYEAKVRFFDTLLVAACAVRDDGASYTDYIDNLCIAEGEEPIFNLFYH